MSIQLSSTAVERVRELLRDQGLIAGGLRVGVKGGGCSGFSYDLSLDSQERPGDEVLDVGGIRVFVDTRSMMYLDGITIDYKDEGMMRRGFIFHNPNASASCGCGESFSV